MILDTQELAASREKERQLRHDMTKLQTDLDKERLKNKTIADKVELISINHIHGTTKDHNARQYCFLDIISFYLGNARQSTDNISRT